MKHRKIQIAYSIVIIIIWLAGMLGPIGVKPVWACMCANPEPPDVAFEEAEAVFRGKVKDISGILLYFFGDSKSEDNITITLEVTDSWKGVDTTQVTIKTGAGWGDCGFDFDIGSEYLVYGHGEPEKLGTGICTRTVAVSDERSKDDFTYLATQPTLHLTEVSESSQSSWFWWLVPIGGIGFVMIIITGLIYVRRRQKSV